MRKVTKKWTTKSGKKIRICDMTDTHLRNTIAMIERAANKIKVCTPYPCFTGEMAQFHAEEEWECLQECEPDYIFPIYSDLCDELFRRQALLTNR